MLKGPAHRPAEVWPLASFLAEEMIARGWRTEDAAIRMGGTADQVARKLMVLDLIMCVQRDNLRIGDDTFDDLARAFDVSAEYFRNLDRVWRENPDRRAAFKVPDSLFGPVSRRALIRGVPSPTPDQDTAHDH